MPYHSYYKSLKTSLAECTERAKSLEGSLIEKETIIKELREQNLRFSADLDNFQKRINEESIKVIKYSSEKIVSELLPVLDSLENATDDGSIAVRKLIFSILQKEGLSEIEDKETFDPSRQEAVGMEDGGQPNTIKKVIRKGYIVGDRVIRPELVILNKGE